MIKATERYTSLCLYEKSVSKMGHTVYVFHPIADVANASFYSTEMRTGALGQKVKNLVLTNQYKGELSEDGFYLIEWGAAPAQPDASGLKKREIDHIFYSGREFLPDILHENNVYSEFVAKGDINSCLSNFQKFEDSQKFDFIANHIFVADSTNHRVGLVLPDNEIEVDEDGGISVSEEATNLSLIELSSDDDFYIDYLGITIRRHLNEPNIQKKIWLKKPATVLTREVLANYSWTKFKQRTKKTKKEYEEFIQALNLISEESLFDDIAQKLCIPRVEALDIFEKYKKDFAEQFAQNDELSTALVELARQSDLLQDVLVKKLSDELYGNHQEYFEGIETQKKTLEEELKTVKAEVSSQREAQKELRQEAELYYRFIQETEQKVKDAKNDWGKLLAEVPLFQALLCASKNCGETHTPETKEAESPIIEAVDHSHILLGKAVETIETNHTLDDFHNFLKDNLEEIGINKTHSSVLSLYLTGLICNLSPLLLAGPGSRLIADALSTALESRTADIVDLSTCDYQEALTSIKSCSGQVVHLENALMKPYLWTLLQAIRDMRLCVIVSTPFADELGLLPQGTFNYVTPLCTELLFEDGSHENDKLFGAELAENLSFDLESKRTKKVENLSALHLSGWALSIIDKQVGLAKLLSLTAEEIDNAISIGTVLSYSFVSNKTAQIAELIENCGLNPQKDIKKEILNYCGVEE